MLFLYFIYKNTKFLKTLNIYKNYLSCSAQNLCLTHHSLKFSMLNVYYIYKNIINFQISLPSEKRRNNTALYNPHSVKELQGNYSYINWLDYINALLPKDLSINDNEIVIVSVPSFFEALGPLLETTPKRTIANYMMWRIHGFSSFFLNEELRKRQLEYSTVLSGREEQEARWKECVDITSGR